MNVSKVTRKVHGAIQHGPVIAEDETTVTVRWPGDEHETIQRTALSKAPAQNQFAKMKPGAYYVDPLIQVLT